MASCHPFPFAWFVASSSGINATADSSAVNVSKVSEIGNLTLAASWTDTSGNALNFSNLVMTDDDGKTYAYNSKQQLVEASKGDTGVLGVVAKVTLSYAGTNSDLAMYVGTYTATIAKSTGARIKTIDQTTVVDAGTGAYADDTLTFSISIRLKTAGTAYDSNDNPYVIVLSDAADGTATAASKTFLIAIEGEKETEDYSHADSGPVNAGTLKVTFA